MYKENKFYLFWIGLLVLGIIVVAQYFSTQYMDVMSKTIAKAIEETEPPEGVVDASGN